MTKAVSDALNTLLPTPIAEQGDKKSSLPQGANNETDENVSSSFGFPAIFSRSIAKNGGKPIQRDEMNTLFNVLSRQVTYFQLGGMATWKAAVASSSYFDGYPPNAIVWHNGKEWRNTSGLSNKTEPGADSAIGWTQIGPTAVSGDSTIDPKVLCPTLNEWRQLIDWTKTEGTSGAATGYLPSDHPDKSADDNGYVAGPGVPITLKDSFENWQTLNFIFGSPVTCIKSVPSVYLSMGITFKNNNSSKLYTAGSWAYVWQLDYNPYSTSGDNIENTPWINLQKDFTTKEFTMGGGLPITGIYGTGYCASIR